MLKKSALSLLVVLLGTASCKGGDASGTGGSGAAGGSGGGSSSASGTGGAAPTGNGTCANTCAKSIALGCQSGEHVQAACEASCETQKANCSAMASAFQTYLDCIEATAMECGEFSDAPSSPQCVSQGLAIFQCAAGGTGGGGGGTGGSGDVPKPVVIASGLLGPQGVAAHGGKVYFTTLGTPGGATADGTVQRVVPGSAPEMLASAQLAPGSVDVDDTGAYWITAPSLVNGSPQGDGTVKHLAMGSNMPTTLFTGLENPGDLRVDDTKVYWGATHVENGMGTGQLLSGPKAGGMAAVLHEDSGYIMRLLPTTEGVYFTTQTTGLHLFPTAGAPAKDLVVLGAWGVDVDSTNVYFLDSAGYSIYKMPRAGGAQVEIVSTAQSIKHPYDLVVTKNFIYFLLEPSSIMRAPIAGGTPEAVATMASWSLGNLAADDAGVYYADPSAGTVVMIPTN